MGFIVILFFLQPEYFLKLNPVSDLCHFFLAKRKGHVIKLAFSGGRERKKLF